jgi:hypothetical protein
VALHRNVVRSIYCGSTQECCHEYLLWLYTGMLSRVFTVALHRNVVTSIYCGSVKFVTNRLDNQSQVPKGHQFRVKHRRDNRCYWICIIHNCRAQYNTRDNIPVLSRVFTVSLHRNVVTSIYCGSTHECCHEYLLWLYTGMLSRCSQIHIIIQTRKSNSN